VDPHLSRLQSEISSAIQQLSPEQLSRSRPGKWSIAQILEHLFLTYTGTTKGLGHVLAEGHSLATKATWKHRASTFIVITLGHMPEGRKSPAVALPRGIPAEKIAADIVPAIGTMNEAMNQVVSTLGERTPVMDHPVLGPLSVQQWRKFHLVHGLHHVGQIQKLRHSAN